jgi:hypothetical protein
MRQERLVQWKTSHAAEVGKCEQVTGDKTRSMITGTLGLVTRKGIKNYVTELLRSCAWKDFDTTDREEKHFVLIYIYLSTRRQIAQSLHCVVQ